MDLDVWMDLLKTTLAINQIVCQRQFGNLTNRTHNINSQWININRSFVLLNHPKLN